ncbi:DUF3168 domain-containing protein [Devosia sp.]|uniref:DUF3168 domain-containing protein n=1 Tax=Devosia sp. TaxID=1871048 RepID=UPI002F09CF7A
MTHPILALQSTLVPALNADAALMALLGAGDVFDAPPRDRHPPYVVIARHDVLARDGDLAPGHEHRLLLHAWAAAPSRKAVLAIAERVVAVALAAGLDSAERRVTHRRHQRTDTAIDPATGFARAAVTLVMFSEPAS